MSTRAVRTEIALQNLDPRLPHNKVDKKGRLVPFEAGTTLEPIVSHVMALEETKIKNALVQLEPIETNAEVLEESKPTIVEIEETELPKKKFGKKDKKIVSTDP